MESKNIFVCGNYGEYISWIPNVNRVYDISKADVVFFAGGTDINPEFYKEPQGLYTQKSDTERDQTEKMYFDFCLKNNIPMVGVCRGAQLGTALSGGKLVQDMCHNHPTVITNYGGILNGVRSDHHQQMYLGEMPSEDYNLIAYTEKKEGEKHLNGNNEDYNFPVGYKEPEIVYFRKTRFLAIQPHPEWSDKDSSFVKFCVQCYNDLFPNSIYVFA